VCAGRLAGIICWSPCHILTFSGSGKKLHLYLNSVCFCSLCLIFYKTRIRSVERGICPIAAVCTVLLSWSHDPGHANVSETFVRGQVATIPGTCLSNLKFVPLAVLELLAFKAHKFTGVT